MPSASLSLGPRVYEGRLSNAPYLNAAGRVEPEDIGRALRVYRAAWSLLFGVVALAGAAVLLLT